MRLASKYLQWTALFGLLGTTVWTIGCAEPASVPPSRRASSGAGSSAMTAGVDVPLADPGAAKSETDTPAAAAEEKKEEPKAEEKKEEPKTEEK